MASIIQIDGKWRAQVRRKGHKAMTRTWSTRELAESWAQQIEAAIEQQGVNQFQPVGNTGPLLGEVIERAMHDPKTRESKLYALKLLNGGLGHIPLARLTAQDIIRYIQQKNCGPATAKAEVSYLGHTLKIAELAWDYQVPDVMDKAKAALAVLGLTGTARKRDRRPSVDELERICQWFDRHSELPMRDLIWFSIHTAMRRGEVTQLRWADYNAKDKTILIRDRKDPKQKQGNHQEVPLLDEAIAIIEKQPTRDGEFIFPYKKDTLSSIFPTACQELGIEDLRWHDLRHEGTSRLFERGYQIHEVAMFTGHKDWAMLRRYTQLKAKSVRRAVVAKDSPASTSELHALLLPLANTDPEKMQLADIQEELHVIERRTEMLQRLRQQIETIDMDDTDRCILLKEKLKAHTGVTGRC